MRIKKYVFVYCFILFIFNYWDAFAKLDVMMRRKTFWRASLLFNIFQRQKWHTSRMKADLMHITCCWFFLFFFLSFFFTGLCERLISKLRNAYNSKIPPFMFPDIVSTLNTDAIDRQRRSQVILSSGVFVCVLSIVWIIRW